MSNLNQFLKSSNTPESPTTLLKSMTDVCVDISKLLKHGPMNGILGMAGAENVQGEDQKKLDVISNDMIKDKLSALSVVSRSRSCF